MSGIGSSGRASIGTVAVPGLAPTRCWWSSGSWPTPPGRADCPEPSSRRPGPSRRSGRGPTIGHRGLDPRTCCRAYAARSVQDRSSPRRRRRTRALDGDSGSGSSGLGLGLSDNRRLLGLRTAGVRLARTADGGPGARADRPGGTHPDQDRVGRHLVRDDHALALGQSPPRGRRPAPRGRTRRTAGARTSGSTSAGRRRRRSCSGFSGRSWSLAIRRLTGSKSLRNVAQHRSRPHVPDPALHPGRVAGTRAAAARSARAGVAPRSPDQGAEVDPVRRGEVDRRPARRRRRRRSTIVDADHLHRQLVLPDQPLGGDLGLGPAPTVAARRGPGPSASARPAHTGAAAADVLASTHCGAHTHSATSGPVVGRHQHPVTDPRYDARQGRGSRAARSARTRPPSPGP